NALLRRGEPMTAENQRGNVKHAASALAALIGQGHSLVITHGNGPQVGLLALQSATSTDGAFPLDVLGAESAGMIGPVYDEATARRLAGERGWSVAPDGDRWRRVVPSPRPLQILEASVILFLTEREVIVICTGGGGVPVVEGTDGSLCGVEAVIDKDLASSLLARQLKADMLLMLTDVDAVYAGFGTPQARALRHVATTEISGRNFPAGSMGPKVGAAIEFAEATGKPAAIGKLEDALAIVRGERGTWLEAPANEAQNS
ncbi:MAG: carbamate kinase, partial [Mesorhizobium sp.]